jgi:hypothetical protein
MVELITCTPRSLPAEKRLAAAERAIGVNALNRPPPEAAAALGAKATDRAFLAIMTAKRWCRHGVQLTVAFPTHTPADLAARILQHMNAWSRTANVRFVQTGDWNDAYVRVTFGDGGYWSYVGTDILEVGAGDPTMNLQGFSMATPDSEFRRVVRHEAGHTLGFPHEHMRRELVDLIDPDKAIRYYAATQGWTAGEVRRQVLTPIDQASIMGTPRPDTNSIMCYQIPGRLTKTGQPIPGGSDIDAVDYGFAGECYPKPRAASPPAAPAVS